MRRTLHSPGRTWREGGRRYKRSRRSVTVWVLRDERKKLQELADRYGISLAGYARAVITDVVEDAAIPSCLAQSYLPRTPSYDSSFMERRRPVGTWIRKEDWDRLAYLARANDVSLAVLLRAAFSEVLDEEFNKT